MVVMLCLVVEKMSQKNLKNHIFPGVPPRQKICVETIVNFVNFAKSPKKISVFVG